MRSASHRVIEQALLSDDELHELQRAALVNTENPFLIQQDVQQQLLGERTSSYAGNGYEFAEHRRYVAGDDMRFINWRSLARTGKLYRKVFHEERRPQCYFIVDRRAPMRFGTRHQLKVTCAVRQAIALLYQARQQQLVTACVVMEDQANWLKPAQGDTNLHTIIQQLNSPCPPVAFSQPQVPLDAVLNELAVRLSPGCIIYILSDFHDLQSASSGSLYHLAQQHKLVSLHIMDPIEQDLPAASHFQLHDEYLGTVIDINTGDKLLRRQFAQAMQQRQQQIEQQLKQTGAEYHMLLTDEHGGRHG